MIEPALSESSEHGTTGKLTMKRLVFAAGVLALGFVASSPARADYAVVRFESGYCQIWWNSASNPWGDNWQKIAIAPDYAGASSALDTAIDTNRCK